ncbi:MAG: hypothetical protein IID32_02780, partial [Planctomycetes bacterium]|nr:hypothetical protein [Planctomycetota bacterium]
DTHTYIYLEDILTQDGTGLAPYASYWCKPTSGRSPDWDMDDTIVSSGPFTDSESSSFNMIDALLAIPTVSLVMEWDDWFSDSSPSGIYANGRDADDNGWERALSAEFFTPDGSEEFQINCAVSIVGGSGVSGCKHDKFSIRLKFKERPTTEHRPAVPPSSTSHCFRIPRWIVSTHSCLMPG